MRPRVLLVASEAIPLIKTGGLADVVSAMAQALHSLGVELTLLLPAYPAAVAALARISEAGEIEEVAALNGLPCGEARLLRGRRSPHGLPVLLLDCAGFRARGGNPYVDAEGAEYVDNAICFASLAHAAVHICAGKTPLPAPHVVHANDWHAALIPAFLRAAGIDHVGTVLTIHNLAFQGNYPLEIASAIGLPPSMAAADGAEFWGRLSFLKAGIRYADRISIVSATYAQEVLSPRFGCGLDGVLNARREAIVPIPNGVDTELWNPECDPLIVRRFSVDDMRNKATCKRALLRMFGLPPKPQSSGDPQYPLLALGSRITHQKMADVALQALPTLLDRHVHLQVVVLGCGEREYEVGFAELAARYPGRIGIHIGYDERRAHALHAGADMLLHGTRFEPFGLTPIYAMRYGTLPIASRVGGILDTVVDASGLDPAAIAASGACGVLFDGEQPSDMIVAVERALALYAHQSMPHGSEHEIENESEHGPQHQHQRDHRYAWRALQRNAMRSDFSWEEPARRYVALYSSIAATEVRLLFEAALTAHSVRGTQSGTCASPLVSAAA